MGLYEFGWNGIRLRQTILKDMSYHLVTPLGSLCKLDFSGKVSSDWNGCKAAENVKMFTCSYLAWNSTKIARLSRQVVRWHWLEVWPSLLNSCEEAYWKMNFNADVTFFCIRDIWITLDNDDGRVWILVLSLCWWNITWKAEFKKNEIKASTVTEMFRYWNLKYLKISRYFTKLFLSWFKNVICFHLNTCVRCCIMLSLFTISQAVSCVDFILCVKISIMCW